MSTWMNDFDIDRAEHLADSGRIKDPNFVRAITALRNLADWTNANSDGWAYWPKPSHAAGRLMDLIQGSVTAAYEGKQVDISAADLKKALTPIKSFLTRQGAVLVLY